MGADARGRGLQSSYYPRRPERLVPPFVSKISFRPAQSRFARTPDPVVFLSAQNGVKTFFSSSILSSGGLPTMLD